MKFSLKSSHFKPHYGFALIVIATLLFSSKAIFIKLAYRYDVNPDTLITLRMLFSLPFYLFIALKARRTYAQGYAQGHTQPLSVKTLFAIASTCICGYYLASVLDLYGLQYISASLERLILYAYPSLIVILSALLFKKPMGLSLLVCITIIYLGLLLVFFNDANVINNDIIVNTMLGKFSPVTIGSTLVFCSAIMFAVYMIGSEQLMRSLPSRLFTSYGMLATCITIAIHFLIRQPIDQLTTQVTPVYLIAGVLAIFCTVVPSFLLSAGIQKIGAATAGAVGCVGPIATLILSFLLLNEPITAMQIIGFAIVISAVVKLGKLKKNA
jgi:drug/metabolite transporter (DMT)-like permease